MRYFPSFPRAFRLMLLSIGAFVLIGCETLPQVGEQAPEDPDRGPDLVFQIVAPSDLSMLQVQQSILNAAFQRNWRVEESLREGPLGKIRLSRTDALYEMNLHVEFDQAGLEAFSESYILNRRGERVRRYNPRTTIRGLRSAIADQLKHQAFGY